MVKEGRTLAKAIAAGNFHQITVYSTTECGTRRVVRQYGPPACESLDEVIECYRGLFGWLEQGFTAEASHVVGGSIGGHVIDQIFDVTVRLQ